MKIYVSHTSSYDYTNQLYTPLRLSKLNSRHEIFLPHEPNEVPINTKAIIEACDIVLAEVSYPSTGQGIELGWANIELISKLRFRLQYQPNRL